VVKLYQGMILQEFSHLFFSQLRLCRYGHGVLRNPDPRFIALQQFCDTRPELKKSSIIDLVNKVRLCDVVFHRLMMLVSHRLSKLLLVF